MTHTINSTGTVAVAVDYFWLPINEHTPRGVKLQLLTRGGVAIYGHWNGHDSFYTDWAPLPKKRDDV